MNRIIIAVACMLISASPIFAQTPELSVKSNGKNSDVYLKSLDVSVKVVGNIASTSFTMTFKNKSSKILEGELLFPLPDGTTVSHYALDINGKMRDAVPVEKAKAAQVFEEIEQRRVDPGLMEKVEGNNFRTRIYPIPAQGTRTITIAYEQETGEENGRLYYRLPMNYKNAIERFSIKVAAIQSTDKPLVSGGQGGELVFDKTGTDYVASFERQNYIPKNSLVFSLPAPKNAPKTFVTPASGSYYFTVSCSPEPKTTKKEWGSRLSIIWDASFSGIRRNISGELNALNIIMKHKKQLSVTLYLLNNGFVKSETFTVENGNWNKLRNALNAVVYDGGTNYGAISLDADKSDEILFFSDGLSTLSDAVVPRTGKPIHCIVSSPNADYSVMKLFAGRTGGKFINLNALSDKELEEELKTESLKFVGIEKPSSVRETYPSISVPVNGNFSLAGIMDSRSAEITLMFACEKSETTQKIKVSLKAQDAATESFVHKIWAQKKITELDLNYEKNKEELAELGKQFGIVTRNTSLIVLETVQDYFRYGIEPPAELQAEYAQLKKTGSDDVRQQSNNMSDKAVAQAKELREWWFTDFKIGKKKYPQPDKINEERTSNYTSANVVTRSESRESAAEIQEILSETVVRHNRRSSSNTDKNEEVNIRSKHNPEIKTVNINSNEKYTKSFTGNSERDYAKYLELRTDYLDTPSFYFYVADMFFRRKEREKALRVLTTIADIDLENASLYRLLGYRLKEYGEYALEKHVCGKVVQWRPFEAQNHRDYALALEDAGEYAEALRVLYSVLNGSFAQNTANTPAIQEVVITEINRIINDKKTDFTFIDKQLIGAMPVDVRVVIDWNMNNTDIDLHVKDPNGETCSFSHNRTEIGGRLSCDITNGYGPEQFMLKKALTGKYEVFINYFGDSRVTPDGPSTIMIEIYTHYSDKNCERKIVCVQLSKKNNAEHENSLLKIAEFEFF